MHSLRNVWGAFALVVVAFFFAASTASAHGVGVWAEVDGPFVNVSAYFSSGGKVKNADVTVLDAAGESMLTGKTDDEGNFQFKYGKPQPMTVIVTAGGHHTDKFKLELADFAPAPEGAPEATAVPTPAPTPVSVPSHKPDKK